MLTFAEEILLLMLNDDTGRMENTDLLAVKYALGGSILMELAVRSKIRADEQGITVTDSSPTGIEILDSYLSVISDSEEKKDTPYWVDYLANHSEDIQSKALEMLCDKQILKEVETKILWVFETRSYPMIHDEEEKEVKKRIVEILYDDETPSERDVVLISLVDTCNLFSSILSSQEVEKLSERISRIKKMDVIGQVVSNAVGQLHMDIAQAMSMAH